MRRGGGIPRPLRDYLDTGLDRIDWRWSGAGLHAAPYPLHETPLEEWDRFLAVDLTGGSVGRPGDDRRSGSPEVTG